MREGQGKRWTVLALLLGALHLPAQEVTLRGGFLEDSLLIGTDINFWVAATYPPDLELVFPDSLYDFSPFEYSGKTYFPTQIKGGLAYDSTIYTLQSFEIDKVQYLQLPAFVLLGKDTTIINTPRDSIYLKELAPVVTDTTTLKTNVDYVPVTREFNYPLLYYVLGGIAALIAIVLLIFGKRMVRWFRLRRLKKNFEQFSESFNQYIEQLKANPASDTAEKALVLWKNYLQQLEKLPFSVLTTKEILALDFTEELTRSLQAIDRLVYGKKAQENIFQDFQQLEDFATERYLKKVAEIKHGK